jgi:hypothetical protein
LGSKDIDDILKKCKVRGFSLSINMMLSAERECSKYNIQKINKSVFIRIDFEDNEEKNLLTAENPANSIFS